MKFKIDENLPIEIANILIEEGYDTATVNSENISGADDFKIPKICEEENRILLTLDLDFSDIRTYPPINYPGFIFLRLKKQDKSYVLNIIKQIVPVLKKEKIQNCLWIVNETGIRIHEP